MICPEVTDCTGQSARHLSKNDNSRTEFTTFLVDLLSSHLDLRWSTKHVVRQGAESVKERPSDPARYESREQRKQSCQEERKG